MEWSSNYLAASWRPDMAGQSGNATFISFAGASSDGGDTGALNLGERAAPPAPPASGAPTRKARATAGAGPVPSACLVDGCTSDLRHCREYHRRHKVCEEHSKSPVVAVRGQQQRFCQQCSRFHLLMEFDEVKRSCRKRLDGHNKRRRKSQQNPLTSASFFPSQVPALISYAPPAALPANLLEPSWVQAAESWPSGGSIEEHNQPFSITFVPGKRFPFSQHSEDGVLPQSIMCRSDGSSSRSRTPANLFPAQVLNSHNPARSLLSPASAAAADTNLISIHCNGSASVRNIMQQAGSSNAGQDLAGQHVRNNHSFIWQDD